jgi:hypothetical protein
MALVEKFPFESKPTLDIGVNALSAKRWTARVVPLVAAVALIASLYGLFASGHPIVAIWTGVCVVAWLFMRGAALASGSD